MDPNQIYTTEHEAYAMTRSVALKALSEIMISEDMDVNYRLWAVQLALDSEPLIPSEKITEIETSDKKTEIEEPLQDIEEVSPLEMIASLERDLHIALAGLRKIIRTDPYLFEGGPSNSHFGRRYEQAFEATRSTAYKTIQRMENHPDGDEDKSD